LTDVSALDPQRDEQGLYLRSELVLFQYLGDAVAVACRGCCHGDFREHRGEFAFLGQLLQGEFQMPERRVRLFAAMSVTNGQGHDACRADRARYRQQKSV
jgi:hypothetical protein